MPDAISGTLSEPEIGETRMNTKIANYQQRMQPPLVVEDVESVDWKDQADVVVVGLGGAGVCAALEAMEGGARVVAVERYSGGGATAISGGVCYAGGGSVYQREAGCDDSPTEMFRYLKKETQGIVRDDTLRKFCDTSTANLQWLTDHGVRFGGSLCPIKTSYPASQYTLYYSGNERLSDYAKVAKPAPRGHRVMGQGLTGANFFEPLKQSALRMGLKLYTYSEARRLLVDKSGTILGVEIRRIPDMPALKRKIDQYNHRYTSNFSRIFTAYGRHILSRVDRLWDHHAESVFIRADRALILTTGGFINNRAMVNKYAPGFLDTMPLGNLGCNGSGIELASTVGGATSKLENVSALRAINPPEAFVQGIVVSPEGRRLTAEDCYQDKMGRHIIEDGGGRAYIILDKTLYRKAFKAALPGPGKVFLVQCAPALMSLSFTAKRASSIEKLAHKCGMNPEVLARAVQENNDVALGKAEDSYKKDPKYISSLVTPPFYAVDISIDRRTFPCPALTLGGLVVDEESGQVVDSAGRPITKLYAAGRCAVGVPSNGYISGLSIADCVFSGRRAGQHCSK